jgi:hypothetical protein
MRWHRQFWHPRSRNFGFERQPGGWSHNDLKNILELGAADTNSLREVGMPKTAPSHFVTQGDSNPHRSHAPAPAKNVRYGDC